MQAKPILGDEQLDAAVLDRLCKAGPWTRHELERELGVGGQDAADRLVGKGAGASDRRWLRLRLRVGALRPLPRPQLPMSDLTQAFGERLLVARFNYHHVSQETITNGRASTGPRSRCLRAVGATRDCRPS